MPIDDDDGPPTSPDVVQLKCPECIGNGYILSSDERGHTTSRTCSVCFGVKFVSRRTWEIWKQRSGSDDEMPETD
jgi:hypothetical protein